MKAKLQEPLSKEQKQALILTLESRFLHNTHRHNGLEWTPIRRFLEDRNTDLGPLFHMEMSAGEPDLFYCASDNMPLAFYDFSPESPKERRSLCYDEAALASRKEHKPKGNAVQWVEERSLNLLTETQYRNLQKVDAIDLKTSSWIWTPEPIRKLGGALFCDRRYNQVFTYHNGAESYYASRGFRCCYFPKNLKI